MNDAERIVREQIDRFSAAVGFSMPSTPPASTETLESIDRDLPTGLPDAVADLYRIADGGQFLLFELPPASGLRLASLMLSEVLEEFDDMGVWDDDVEEGHAPDGQVLNLGFAPDSRGLVIEAGGPNAGRLAQFDGKAGQFETPVGFWAFAANSIIDWATCSADLAEAGLVRANRIDGRADPITWPDRVWAPTGGLTSEAAEILASNNCGVGVLASGSPRMAR